MTARFEQQLRELEEADDLLRQYEDRFGPMKISYRFISTQFVDVFKEALRTGIPYDFETGKFVA